MKQILALLVAVALLGGCSKTSSTSTEQATAAAADQPAAVTDTSDASAAPAASAGGSSTAGTPRVLPVYPGATRSAGKSSSYSDGGQLTKVDYYDTKDDGPTVAAWYKDHLPSDWDRNMGNPARRSPGHSRRPTRIKR
jgi:hypothetical protein